MAVATIFVVAVFLFDALKGLAPVAVVGVPLTHVAYQGGDHAILWDDAQATVEQFVDVALDESLCLHGGDDLRAIDGLAVMADAAGTFGQIRR